MSTAVKYFNSSMSGAPSLDNTAGDLIAVLDACLIDGFGEVTLDSLEVDTNVATALCSAGHQFTMIGDTGPVIRIAGCTTLTGLNADWRVTLTSTTTFEFATTGISDGTEDVDITAKRAPAGFTKTHTATNKAAYRADDITSTRLYLRVDDSATNSSHIRGYESFADQAAFENDTGTGPFPTDAQISGGGYVYKATSTSRAWTLFSDGAAIYFFCDTTGNDSYQGGFYFGDGLSYVAADAFGAMLISSNTSTATFPINTLTHNSGTGVGGYLARPYTQIGTSQISYRYSHGRSGNMGANGQPYPALTGNAFHAWPVDYWEDSNNARGLMPGLWNPLHAANPPHGTVIDDVENLPGRTLLIQKTAGSYRCAFDITGPWR